MIRTATVTMPKQARFATMLTLNDLAFLARKKVFRPEVKKKFTLRNKFLTKGLQPGAKGPGGIGVDKATKRRLEARIFYGKGAEFLTLQEDSGTKLPKRGKGYIRVPEVTAFPGAVLGRKVFRPAKYQRRLDKPGSRVFTMGRGTPRARVVERLRGKVKGTRVRKNKRGHKLKPKKAGRREVRTLWWLEKQAKIEKAINVRPGTRALVLARGKKTFLKRLKQARRTAKR